MNLESKYARRARFKYRTGLLVDFLMKRRTNFDVEKVLFDFSKAKHDVISYFNMDEKKYWEMCKVWPKIEEELFLQNKDVSSFYRSWKGDISQANISANVCNQFVSYDIYQTTRPYIEQADTLLDLGCGTASVTLAHLSSSKKHTAATLVEVQQDVRNFIEYRIASLGLNNITICDPDELLKQEGQFDLVMCIDVLEHLENPTEVFKNSILPNVKMGGYLVLRAPWRGQLTHIDEAPKDFYQKGGRELLAKHFVEYQRIGAADVSAVYKRVR